MSARIGAACLLAVLLLIVKVNGCSDDRLIRYYKELGCSPVPADSNCPTSFECARLNRQDIKKCWLKGQQYDVGQTISESGDPCVPECSCRSDGKRAELNCVSSDCPEHLWEEPMPEGCYYKHGLDECCSVGVQCVTNETKVIKCQYEGEEYYEGQLMYKSNDPCKVCICDKSFDSEPHCREVDCGLELHSAVELQKGCAPVFYGKSTCCPIEWRCPRRGDTIMKQKPKNSCLSTNFTGTMCSFGRLKLEVGDSLVGRHDKCLQCSCQMPPHVTCIQKSNCPSRPRHLSRALDACSKVHCAHGCCVGKDGEPHCVP